jgi:hypothetical protein
MYNPSHNDEALLRLVAQVKQTIHEATAALARRLPTDPVSRDAIGFPSLTKWASLIKAIGRAGRASGVFMPYCGHCRRQ